MPSLPVSPPAAHGTLGQVGIDGHDVHLGIAQEPAGNILPGRPEPNLDDDAQLDPYGGWHQPDKSIFKMSGKLVAARLGEDDRNDRRRINDEAAAPRHGQRGKPVSS